MTNPATELAVWLEQWASIPEGESVTSVRDRGSGVISNQTRAAECFAAVLATLDALDSAGDETGHYRVFIPDWWDAVFAPRYDWNVLSGSKPVLNPQHIAALRGLGQYLDGTGFRAIQTTEASRVASRDALSKIATLLEQADPPLDAVSRRYAAALVSELQATLGRNDADVRFDVFRRINELRGLLEELADQAADTPAGRNWSRNLRTALKQVRLVSVQTALVTGFALEGWANFLAITTGH